MYGDNRDMPAKIKTKYHRHTDSFIGYFLSAYKPPAKIVDVGTRDGYAVELLTNAKFDALGTDLIQEFVDYAQDHKRNVIQDDIMASSLPSCSFNFVVSRHCLEHCRNPELFLSEAARVLYPWGIIMITFPLECEKKAAKNKYHLCNFKDKNAFRKIANNYFSEISFCKSKRLGLITDGDEVLYHGRKLS